jgi:hypothetical protein
MYHLQQLAHWRTAVCVVGHCLMARWVLIDMRNTLWEVRLAPEIFSLSSVSVHLQRLLRAQSTSTIYTVGSRIGLG